VGEQGKEWFALSARPWIYPAGTRLSWHDDAATYCGAFVYYAHPSWNALWGGELLVAHEGVRDRAPGANTTRVRDDPLQLDNQAENDELMREGHGRFVAAKPNRLVFLGAGVSHMVAQVHAAAGDHPRVTVSGFFLRKPRTGAETLDYLFGPQSKA
jgi:Rps23 Pro-64 3,4-dihydroxylase Tpa1-like proline 4-hydroxylase